MEPYFFHRILKEKVWGGEVLSQKLGLELPFTGPLGETWELSDYPGEETVVRGGSCDGQSLRALMEKDAATLLGKSRPTRGGRFPLLVKLLDAGDDLSVQIHPPDGPLSPNGVGKTEAWYILHRAPGGKVICGLNPGTSKEVFEQEAGDSRVRAHLAEIEIEAGDCVFVPAGQTHAVRKGVVLCEVQQTSDVTYRMYDWDRLGLDGQPRETHLREALQVVNYDFAPAQPQRAAFGADDGLQFQELASCDYFRLIAVCAGAEGGPWPTHGYAQTLSVVDGSGFLSSTTNQFPERALQFGDTVLLPGALDEVSLRGTSQQPLKLLVGVAL